MRNRWQLLYRIPFVICGIPFLLIGFIWHLIAEFFCAGRAIADKLEDL